MFMNKKTIIFSAFLLIVIVGTYLYARQRPESGERSETAIDTSGWEKYRNEQYKFEVKYPKGVVLRAGKFNTVLFSDDYLGVPKNLRGALKEVELSKDGYFMGSTISVFNLSNPTNVSVTDWMSINRADIVQSADSQQDIVFQNIPALRLEREDRGIPGRMYAYRESTIYFFHNGNLFSISSVAPPKSPSEEWRAHPYYQYLEKSVPITEAIINSFRFIE
jgi:hypothetical protein